MTDNPKSIEQSKAKKESLLGVIVKNYLTKNPEQLTAIQSAGKRINEYLNNPELLRISRNITIKLKEFDKTLSDPKVIAAFKSFIELPEKRKQAILNMSENGWYPFEESIKFVPFDDQTIDDYMVTIIEDNYENLKAKILEKYADRREILSVAFQLVEDSNHIAAIPLLFIQIDGISNDNHGVYYFTGTKFPIHLKKRAEVEWDEHTYDLFNTILEKANKAFVSDRFEHLKNNINDLNILNRGGILHGDKDFLNYGNKINAYKVISLLMYVDWMSELLDEEQN